MAEYIKRKEALEITTRTCGDYAAAWAEIRKLPAADVAEVVRCKDCEFSVLNEEGEPYCIHRRGLNPGTDDCFCSYGKRREE